MKKYNNLTCISPRTSVQLSNTHNIAAFIMNEGLYGDVVIKTEDGNTLLNTFGVFIDRIADMEYRSELLKELVPMQMGTAPADYIQENTEVESMNEWDRLTRQGQRYQAMYPEGTRVLLIQMGNDPRPISPNTRGTVKFVDDIGTVHCRFDNGRSLGIVPGEDSFRKLTQEEIEEENNTICVEETVEDDINDDQDEGFGQSM